jgi:cytochrome b561
MQSMQKSSHSTHYSKPVVFLHWLMLALMVTTYAAIELRELFPKGTEPREFMKSLHFMFGLTVLISVSFRIYFRLSSSSPAIVPAPNLITLRIAQVMHLMLYLLMIGMPIAGWLILSAAGKPIPFFGLELSPLIAENKELSKSIKSLHETAGSIGYFLIGIHAIAGLFHHYVVKDNTLKRIIALKE